MTKKHKIPLSTKVHPPLERERIKRRRKKTQAKRNLTAEAMRDAPPPKFDQTTSWNTPGFVEAFRVAK